MADTIDLNCDLGEGFGVYRLGDDEAMLEIVTSANVACGFHAGDPIIMHQTIETAKRNGVRIGAHPSLMDFWGFGRRMIQGENPEDIIKQLTYQIGAILTMARVLDWPITHVKTHGALGNMAALNGPLAEACVSAVKMVDDSLAFVTMPYSETFSAANKAGLNVICEVFADRTYDDFGRLTPRSQDNAVIHDTAQSTEHVLRMVQDKKILTTGGELLDVEPDTICIHGDNPGAVEIAAKLKSSLGTTGVTIAPFVPLA